MINYLAQKWLPQLAIQPLVRRKVVCRLALFGLLLTLTVPPAAKASSTIFGGDPFYTGGTAVMNTLRASGYTTVMLWTIHVNATSGNLIYNDQLVVSNGVYVGNSAWPAQLATLKTAPTSVNRIEWSVGSAPSGGNDFANILTLMNAYGTNTGSILYRNFLALKNATGADAIDYDDESQYDVPTSVKFGQMLTSIGYKVTLCPYTNPGFWQSVYSQLGSGVVDRVYLQCYAGGAGNDPGTWNAYFPGLTVIPGMWGLAVDPTGSTVSQVEAQMAAWHVADDIPGGFIWLYDNIAANPADGTPAEYAAAVNTAVDPLVISPANGFTGIAAYNLQVLPANTVFTLSNASTGSLSWSLVNTSSWLNVSSSSGTLTIGTTTPVTVSLNTSAATNLAAGTYAADIVFSNRTTGVTLTRTFTLDTAIGNWPIAFNGFNAALLAPDTATASAPDATPFDIPNDYCFYQSGLSGSTRGLPLNGVFVSQSDTATAFEFGAYGILDALLLGDTYQQSGTLTLATPLAYDTLTILACSANGSSSSQGTFVINFSNGTHSSVFNFNAQDWFNTTTNVAIQGFGRLQLETSLSIDDDGDSNPNMYQTTVNLAALELTQPISSITFSGPASGGRQTTAVFALSGMPGSVPVRAPEGLIAIPGTNSTVQLIWHSSDGAVSYEIQRSLASGSSYAVIGTTTGTNYSDTGLINGVTYYYVVSAIGVINTSNSVEVSAVPGSYESRILSDNPASYWQLNETNGSVAYDYISGNNGIYTPAVSLGQPGNNQLDSFKAAGFGHLSSINSCVTNIAIDFATAGNATFSVEAWVNGGTQTTDAGLVTKGYGGGGEQFNLDCGGNNHAFRFFVRDAGGNTHLATGSLVPDNHWHHLVGVCDEINGGVYLYIDGTNTAQTTVGASAGILTSTLDMSIGSRESGLGTYYNDQFVGEIEKVAIYDYALNANQILAHYQTATNYLPDLPQIISQAPGKLAVEWVQGTLLQSTNLNGPWITNSAVSPFPVEATNSQMYFRVRVR